MFQVLCGLYEVNEASMQSWVLVQAGMIQVLQSEVGIKSQNQEVEEPVWQSVIITPA